MGTHAIELRLPRNCSIHVGSLSRTQAQEIREIVAAAQKGGQGLIATEERSMKVSEVAGLSTGRIQVGLVLTASTNLAKDVARVGEAGEGNIKLIAAIPADAVAKGEFVEREEEARQAVDWPA